MVSSSIPFYETKKMTKLSAFFVIGLLAVFNLSAVAAPWNSSTAEHKQSLLQNGIKRNYLVRLPPKLPNHGRLVPLVLVLHGGGGNAANAERMSGFTDKAARENFIVVYPEGSSRLKGKLQTWNAGHCCGYAMEKGINDVAFINALLDRLIKDYPVDPKRIYATGMSNGGMMTHKLGIELSSRFAAIAPLVATLFGDEIKPEHAVSAMFINGMLDKPVPYQGSALGGRFPNAWDGSPTKPAIEQAIFWANANNCSAIPDKLEQGAVIQWQYHCPANKDVALYLIKDSGHAWPGGQKGSSRGDEPSLSLNATDLIWTFFKSHTK